MRRLYRVNSVSDFSGLDEPVVLLGSTPLSLRNLAAIALGLAAAGTGFLLGGPSLPLKPVPLSLGGLLGLTAGLGIVMWSTLQRPDRPGLPLLSVLLPGGGERGRARRGRAGSVPVVEVGADEDTGLARVELEGYAFDPASGSPLDAVDIEVDGRVYTVEARRGKYYLELELPRGVHEVTVMLHGSRVVLRRYILRVV